jgi:hypothetical protein
VKPVVYLGYDVTRELGAAGSDTPAGMVTMRSEYEEVTIHCLNEYLDDIDSMFNMHAKEFLG